MVALVLHQYVIGSTPDATTFTTPLHEPAHNGLVVVVVVRTAGLPIVIDTDVLIATLNDLPAAEMLSEICDALTATNVRVHETVWSPASDVGQPDSTGSSTVGAPLPVDSRNEYVMSLTDPAKLLDTLTESVSDCAAEKHVDPVTLSLISPVNTTSSTVTDPRNVRG